MSIISDYTYDVERISSRQPLSLTDQQGGRQLLNVVEVNSSFNINTDRITLDIYSFDGKVLYSETNLRSFGVEREGRTNQTEIDTLLLYPDQDAISYGFDRGDVYLYYNFIRDLSTLNQSSFTYFIESISPDRTELRALTTSNSPETINKLVEVVKEKLNEGLYFEELRLSSGTYYEIIINIEKQEINGKTYLLLKLLRPLEDTLEINSIFSVVETVGDEQSFAITSSPVFTEEQRVFLGGPNFNIQLPIAYSIPSDYKNLNDILLEVTGSNYRTYSSTNQAGAFISIDHTEFSNFIHFSSAYERLTNFRFKLGKIQDIEISKSLEEASNSYNKSLSLTKFNEELVSLLRSFDSYERFLFFESGSKSWPKVNSVYPYINRDIYDQESIDFYYSQSVEASFFDNTNTHRLLNAVPIYIKDDPANAPYNLFIDMIGQHFDILWTYAKAISDRYNADNRLNFGISKDIVSHALSGFGMKIYGSSENFDNLFKMFVGEFFTTGSEQINTFISSSQNPVPREEYQKQIYKRIYHNVPLILKSKGTEKSVRALINSFGIPDETLKIRVFGGQKVDNRPFLGPFNEFTGSVDKIRVDNTGSMIVGNTLSNLVSITKPDYVYTQDLHPVEIGFSPAYSIENYILSSSLLTGSFDMDAYIGDPRSKYSNKYQELEKYSKGILSGSLVNRFDLYDFVRSVKFFDTTVFKMIKDLIPARNVSATGLIIKSNFLERNKLKQVEPKWSLQDKIDRNVSSSLDYTNGIPAYENNFSYYANISSIGNISAGHGRSFNTGSLTGSFDDLQFIEEYDTRYSYSRRLPVGNYDEIKTHDETKYDGEFGEIVSKIDGTVVYKPHNIYTTDGELNKANIFKKTNYKPYYFLIRALRRIDPELPPDCTLVGSVNSIICCQDIEGCYGIIRVVTDPQNPNAPDPTPCPPPDTLLNTICIGTDLYRVYSNGLCGTYNVLLESNNVETCGYVEPGPTPTATPTPGPTSTPTATPAPTPTATPPPAGTILETTYSCDLQVNGRMRYFTKIANGTGGFVTGSLGTPLDNISICGGDNFYVWAVVGGNIYPTKVYGFQNIGGAFSVSDPLWWNTPFQTDGNSLWNATNNVGGSVPKSNSFISDFITLNNIPPYNINTNTYGPSFYVQLTWNPTNPGLSRPSGFINFSTSPDAPYTKLYQVGRSSDTVNKTVYVFYPG